MFARFARSLIAFGVVFVAYQAYALLAPPLIEGPGLKQAGSVVDEEDWDRGSDAVRRYQKLLAHYLPNDHWALSGPIKVVESGRVLLAFDDWDRDDSGRVRLTRLVTLMFPTPRAEGGGARAAAPRDAVVLEAAGDPGLGYAAELQFDEGFDPARGRVGRITSGRFPGPITIHSDGAEPGVEDDLWLGTRDLRLNGPLLSTPHEVRVRHGLSRGGGRNLEIKLIEEPGGAAGDGLKIAGVESIEIFEQVSLTLHAAGGRLSGGPAAPRVTRRDPRVSPTAHEPTPAGPPPNDVDVWLEAAGDAPRAPRPAPARQPDRAAIAAAAEPSPPIEVTCDGSLEIDLLGFVARFSRRVIARQPNPAGPSDQLVCERLDVHFAEEGVGRVDPAADPDFARNQRLAMKGLRPRRLAAYGAPVKLDAPARGLIARGQRLDVLVDERRVTLAGEGAFLRHTAGEVHAPLVRYQHPAEGAATPIGRLWVAGPGWLRVRGSGEAVPGAKAVTARWGQTPGVEFPVQLVRRERGPVLVVLGRPEIEAPGLGRLSADRLEATLLETPADGPRGPATEIGDHAVALLPEQINARGRVVLESPELRGQTEELAAWVRPGRAAASPPTGGSLRRKPAAEPTTDPADARRARHELTAQRMELDVRLTPGRATPHRLVCLGGAQFREQPRQPGEEPLVVAGNRIRVDRLDTPALRIDVLGAPAGARPPAEGPAPVATLAARGVRLAAAEVHLDQQSNRMWADGPGSARLRTDRDLLGQATGAATDLHLRWRGGFDFDGQAVVVREDVFGEGPHDTVKTQRLVATLSRRVDFQAGRGSPRGRGPGGPVVEVAKVECTGGVAIDHRSIDQRGQRSHERAELRALVYDHRTAALTGQGPGSVRSTHLSSGGGLGLAGGRPAQQPAGQPRPAPANASPPAEEKLRYLRVDFLQGVTGNLNDRVLAFHGRVQAVYGPVLAWQHQIAIDSPSGPPPDTARLDSDHLQVNEDPRFRGGGGRLGPVELLATGSVRLETARKSGGLFASQSTTASYAQAKELFTIEGAPGNYATVWIQDKPGQPAKVQNARKFSFWRSTNQLRIEDLGGFDSSPLSRPRPASAPSSARRR